MTIKDMVAKDWLSLIPSFDGFKYSDWEDGDKPSGYQSRPTLLDTDINWGSLTGGENNKGSYMSLWGYNLGRVQQLGTSLGARVYFRDPLGDNAWHEVDNYRAQRQALVYDRLQVIEIIVQLGSLGGGIPDGRVLDIKINVGGTDTNILLQHFTKRTGRFFFFDNATGNDATAVVDDISKPFRYLQYLASEPYTFSGIFATTTAMGQAGVGPYDTIVGRVGTGTYTDVTGYSSTWCRFRTYGQNDIHITAYPGSIGANAPEDVHYACPAGFNGGIHGTGLAFIGNVGLRISISRLRIESDPLSNGVAAPINLQNGADGWRIYGNDLGPWLSTTAYPNHGRAGGIAGQGVGVKVKFNVVHEIGCNPSNFENHGIYCGDNSDNCSRDWEIAYNWLWDISGGSGIQWNNNSATDTFDNMSCHHNWIEGVTKYGINCGNSITNLDVYNNVVLDCMLHAIRFDVLPDITTINVLHNIFMQTRTAGAYTVMVGQTWSNQTAGAINFKFNICAFTDDHSDSLTSFTNFGAGDTALDMSQNIWWDFKGTITDLPTQDTDPIHADPLFTSIALSDYTYLAGSPAIAGCTEPSPLAIADDFYGVDRLVTDTSTPSTVFNDIGAMQGVGT